MKILVINAGSSSLKYKLFNMDDSSVMAEGIFERIGEESGIWTHVVFVQGSEDKFVQALEVKNHKTGMLLAADRLIDPGTGVVDDLGEIDAIGHRVVQGGEAFVSAAPVDDQVKQTIRDNFSLAPLHNPPNLTGIELAQELFPGIVNIAVFDTQFHQTMPEKAFLYALPYEYYTRFKIRKYGFHGTSHKYISKQAAGLLGKNMDTLNLITIHLGNGCSVSAIEKGKCIDTSMGMTPLAGLMMGTRTGDIDPGVIGYLLKSSDMDLKELEMILNKKSGLKGICGMNDMRDIHKACAKGDARAELAIDMFCFRIKKHIGAYAAVLGSIDAIVFSGGIGENDEIVRAKACENLSCLGIEIDPAKNCLKQSGSFAIHTRNSPVQVWVVPTNEELQIANEVMQILR